MARRLNDVFLTPIQKDEFSHWQDKTNDNTISTIVLQKVWEKLAPIIPNSVAPNILSLAGLLLLIHAWYLSEMYLAAYPVLISFFCMLLIIAQLAFDRIGRLYAKNTMQDSPLIELFYHSCNTVGYVFSAMVGTQVLGITNKAEVWYLIQIGQLLALTQHLGAFKRANRVLRYPMFTGPGEVVFGIVVVLAIKVTFGLGDVIDFVTQYVPILQVSRIFYYVVSTVIVFEVMLTLPTERYATRNGLCFCLLYRMVPSLLMYAGLLGHNMGSFDILCDGLFMTILTTEIVLSKMSGSRDLHPWIVIFAMVSLMGNFFTVVSVVVYYSCLFYEISEYLEVSVFTVTVNVYVDGAYDMCHLGHINSFRAALSFGTRLIVGVLSDEAIKSYKRAPIMNTKERCDIVGTCKYVHKVIPDAPFPGIPAEFIRKHRIHVVCHSAEYESEDDKYYAIPRAMGITRLTPRTEGMSTSELIRRVQRYAEAGNLVNKQEEELKKKALEKEAAVKK